MTNKITNETPLTESQKIDLKLASAWWGHQQDFIGLYLETIGNEYSQKHLDNFFLSITETLKSEEGGGYGRDEIEDMLNDALQRSFENEEVA